MGMGMQNIHGLVLAAWTWTWIFSMVMDFMDLQHTANMIMQHGHEHRHGQDVCNVHVLVHVHVFRHVHGV
jgi:hypothetical protein